MASSHEVFRERLQQVVRSFGDEIGYGRKVEVSKPYFPYAPASDREKYPDAASPGVYVFTDGKRALYVGKCARCLGNRIWTHIGRCGRSGESRYPMCEPWVEEAGETLAVFSIPLADEHWFLASALEGYISEKLEPAHGAGGRRS